MEKTEILETTPNTETPAGEEVSEEKSEEASVPAETKQDLLEVKFNHKTHNLTMDEAKTLAQKGMLYESKGLNDIYAKLDYLAAQGEISVDEFVNGLLEKDEAKYRESIAEKCGDDKEMLENLTTLYKNRQKEKYGKIIKERQENEEKEFNNSKARLELEFNDLKQDFNDLDTIEDLPLSVVEKVLDGENLLSAYLVFLHNENKKINAAKEASVKASAAAMEKVKSTEQEVPVNSAFVAGLWQGI